MKTTGEKPVMSKIKKNELWYISDRQNKPEQSGENRIDIFQFLVFLLNFYVTLGAYFFLFVFVNQNGKKRKKAWNVRNFLKIL